MFGVLSQCVKYVDLICDPLDLVTLLDPTIPYEESKHSKHSKYDELALVVQPMQEGEINFGAHQHSPVDWQKGFQCAVVDQLQKLERMVP